MAATPFVTHIVMPLDRASIIVVSLVSDNRGVFITFVLLGLLAIILGRLGQLLAVVVPAPLAVLVSVI